LLRFSLFDLPVPFLAFSSTLFRRILIDSFQIAHIILSLNWSALALLVFAFTLSQCLYCSPAHCPLHLHS
jgi:hypothetical protein